MSPVIISKPNPSYKPPKRSQTKDELRGEIIHRLLFAMSKFDEEYESYVSKYLASIPIISSGGQKRNWEYCTQNCEKFP